MKKALSITLALILTSSLLGQQFPFQNPCLSSEERAKDLITRLTVEEKAALMCDQSDAIKRLGISVVKGLQGSADARYLKMAMITMQ